MLVSTRLHPPPLRPDHVHRARLLAHLDHGLDGQMTLVSAPAGFGKSTAAVAWMDHLQRPFVWLSLAEGEDDPTVFWRNVVAALQQRDARIGQRAATLLRSPKSPAIERVVSSLLNDLDTSVADSDGPSFLVLDDFHHVQAPAIHDSVNEFLDGLPAAWHVLILTRENPPLNLAARHAHGQLHRIGVDELRFERREIGQFLHTSLDLELADDQLEQLAERTEGWAASLQLAAISLRNHADPVGFIAKFRGDDRFVMDFLMDEVFHRQPEDVQRFLLATSLLDRMCGDLCEALFDPGNSVLAGVGSGQAMLDYLEHANIFVVQLDDQRHWYRYHHLFRDLLLTRLHRDHGGWLATLHRRAALWHEQAGDISRAIDHAKSAGDPTNAIRLIETHGNDYLWRRGAVGTLIRWLERLPREVADASAQVCLLIAWSQYLRGDLGAAAPLIERARRQALDRTVAGDDDGAQFQEAEALRALLAVTDGDLAVARKVVPEIQTFVARRRADSDRSYTALTVAYAELQHHLGQVRDAEDIYIELLRVGARTRNTFLFAIASVRLCDVARVTGDLDLYATHLDNARSYMQRAHIGSMGECAIAAFEVDYLRERNRLAEARVRAEVSRTKRDDCSVAWTVHDSLMIEAELEAAAGDFAASLALCERAARLAEEHRVHNEPTVYRAQTLKAWIQIVTGDLAAAGLWARLSGPGDEGDVTFANELDHLVFARLLIATQRPDDALALLGRLRDDARAGGRTAREVQTLTVSAMAHEAAGNRRSALAAMREALGLAEPTQLLRAFLQEGMKAARLLYLIAADDVPAGYAKRVLAAFPEQAQTRPVRDGGQPLVEPLTAREQEVLQLIADGQANKAIAEQLSLSLHTVKVHTRNIYRKLDVQSRTQAVSRAQRLGHLQPRP